MTGTRFSSWPTPRWSADLHVVGVLAEAALEQAILGAVKSAPGLGVLPAYQDIYPGGSGQ